MTSTTVREIPPRILHGRFSHDDTPDFSVRFEGAPLRLTIVQALALAESLNDHVEHCSAASRISSRLRTAAAAALAETYGMPWERACALVDAR